MKEVLFAHMSEGALVVDVKEDTDTKEIPPCEYSKDDKMMIRWRAYAQDLGGEPGAKLTDLLDQYPISVTKDEIKAFIRSTREGK